MTWYFLEGSLYFVKASGHRWNILDAEPYFDTGLDIHLKKDNKKVIDEEQLRHQLWLNQDVEKRIALIRDVTFTIIALRGNKLYRNNYLN